METKNDKSPQVELKPRASEARESAPREAHGAPAATLADVTRMVQQVQGEVLALAHAIAPLTGLHPQALLEAGAAHAMATTFVAPGRPLSLVAAPTLPLPPPNVRVPPCDVVDSGTEVVVQAELPGSKREHVTVRCTGQAIALDARVDVELDVGSLVSCERGAIVYHRVLALPAEVDPAACRATLRDGILTVVLPKLVPTFGPRKVPVE